MERIEVAVTPTRRQWDFITCPADIILFGGARGGAKTIGSLLDFWYHAIEHGDNARGLMVRKQRTDLRDTILTAIRLYGSAAEWHEHGSYFQFPNGARLSCAYLERETDAEAYQGWSLTRVYIEEAGQFTSLAPTWRLMATLRSSAGVKCQMRLTCNPGGPSHFALKSFFVDNGPDRIVRDPETGLTRCFIPSKIADNPHLLANDPNYVQRLMASGSAELRRMWIDGDWDAGLEGQFFTEWSRRKHVIEPFAIPELWTKARGLDWGSARPFAVLWAAVVQDTFVHDGKTLPRGALVIYREYYGMQPGKPNEGLKLPAEEVAREIVKRETRNGRREKINYGVADPACFAVISGPSIAETLMRHGAVFRRADNTRVSIPKMGGWSELRGRLKGDLDGNPMLFVFSTCRDLIRTTPMMLHDPTHPEDLDSDLEDHLVDTLRYLVMSRAYRAREPDLSEISRSPYLVSRAFRLHELKD